MPPQAAATLALEKNTLIRKLSEMVAMANDVISQKMITGLLFLMTAPYLAMMHSKNIDTIMNMRLVINQAAQ